MLVSYRASQRTSHHTNLHYDGGRQTAGGASAASSSSSGTLPPPQPPPKPPDVAFSEGGAACSSSLARIAARRDPPAASTSDDFTSARASAACRSAVVPSSAQNGHGASDVFDVEPPPRQPQASAAAFNAGPVHTRPPVVGSTYCGICRDTAASWSRARTVSIDMRRLSASFILRSRRITGRSGAFDAARTAATARSVGCAARRSAGCAERRASIAVSNILHSSACIIDQKLTTDRAVDSGNRASKAWDKKTQLAACDTLASKGQRGVREQASTGPRRHSSRDEPGARVPIPTFLCVAPSRMSHSLLGGERGPGQPR